MCRLDQFWLDPLIELANDLSSTAYLNLLDPLFVFSYI